MSWAAFFTSLGPLNDRNMTRQYSTAYAFLLQAKADRVIYLALEETQLYGEEWNPVYHPSLSPHIDTSGYIPTADNVSFYFSPNLYTRLQ